MEVSTSNPPATHQVTFGFGEKYPPGPSERTLLRSDRQREKMDGAFANLTVVPAIAAGQPADTDIGLPRTPNAMKPIMSKGCADILSGGAIDLAPQPQTPPAEPSPEFRWDDGDDDQEQAQLPPPRALHNEFADVATGAGGPNAGSSTAPSPTGGSILGRRGREADSNVRSPDPNAMYDN